MKGYVVPYGYMGWIDGRYKLFSTEDEYVEIIRERNSWSTTKGE